MLPIFQIGLPIVRSFRQKNNSGEDGKDETNGLFRMEFWLFCGTETLGILFRTIPRKRKMLGILFRETDREANFRNFVPKHFMEENTLSVLFARTGNFNFESLCQNPATENLKNSVRKDNF